MRMAFAMGFLACTGLMCAAAEAPPAGDLVARSLSLREALHKDPSLPAPFDRLVSMYREAGRLNELTGIYRSQLAEHPDDVNALTVCIRVLGATGDSDALKAARSAVSRYPDNAYLRYLLSERLRADHDPAALTELDKAIQQETIPARKRAWTEALVPQAMAEDRRDLAEKHLKGLAADVAKSPDAALDAARKMLDFRLYALALDTLAAAAKGNPSAETSVEIEMAAAAAEVGLDRVDAARARLDRLLGKLPPDYSQRPEIVRRRIALARQETERQALLKEARDRLAARPNDEAAVLQLAQTLDAFELRRDALNVLLEGSKRIPASAPIEKQALDLLGRLHDERGCEAYLADRLKAQPGRKDLALAHVKALFLVGRRGEATLSLGGLVGALGQADQVSQLIEMARYLRRSTLQTDAVKLFDRVLQIAPARLDIRSELADTYLSLGDRLRAKEVLAAVLPKEATVENVLAIVPLMLQQEMVREARAALAARVETDPKNLDLRLLLLSVEGRLGDLASADKLLLDTRTIADTGALYRRWLEAAVAREGEAPAEPLGRAAEFLEQEQARLALERGAWTADHLERRLAFADLALRNGRKAEVAQLIKSDLDTNPPPDVRSKLRRRLLDTMKDDPAQLAAAEEQINSLAKEDPQAANEYRALMAVLLAQPDRIDLAMPILDSIQIASIQDPALLSSLRTLFEQCGRPDRMFEVVGRLTALDPTNRANWEQWLALLAAAGDESRFRSVARQLLAGTARVPLGKESVEALEAHIVSSTWRSIARLIADGAPGPLGEALVLLDSVERHTRDRQNALWATWARAYVLNRLGRGAARGQAIQELERLTKDGGEARAAGDRVFVQFPDGLAASLAAARKLLTATLPQAEKPPLRDRTGPLPPLKVKWVFESGANSPVTRILLLDPLPKVSHLPLPKVSDLREGIPAIPSQYPPEGLKPSGGRVLICEQGGGMYCLDRATGKLLWQGGPAAGPAPRKAVKAIPAPPPVSYQGSFRGRGYFAPPPRYYAARPQEPSLPPLPLTDGEGRIFVPAVGSVDCHSAADGHLLWRAEVGGAAPPSANLDPGMPIPGPTYVSVCLRKDTVLAFDPPSSRVAAFDRATGKLRWDRTLQGQAQATATCFNSGASLSGDRLLVYGRHAAILDADTGEVAWSFEPSRVQPFPLKLVEPEGAAPQKAAAVLVPSASYPSYRSYSGLSPYAYSGPSRYYPGSYSRIPYPASYPANPVVLDYTQTTAQHYMSSEYIAQGFLLPGPAVGWAYGLDRNPLLRFGLVAGDHLLLFGPNGSHILRLDLPLVGRRSNASGTFVGMAGTVAVLLQGGSLMTTDVATGATRGFDLREVLGGSNPVGRANLRAERAVQAQFDEGEDEDVPMAAAAPEQREPRIQAAVDGVLVYVSGPRGLLCVNARTGNRVFRADWPQGLAARHAPPGPLQRPGGGTQYIWQGVLRYNPEGGGTCLPLVDCVADGVYYATLSPSQVVALVERQKE